MEVGGEAGDDLAGGRDRTMEQVDEPPLPRWDGRVQWVLLARSSAHDNDRLDSGGQRAEVAPKWSTPLGENWAPLQVGTHAVNHLSPWRGVRSGLTSGCRCAAGVGYCLA